MGRSRSGVRARRVRGHNIYVRDGPVTGLHLNDVDALIGVLDRILDEGSTVIVIEHGLDVHAPAGSSIWGPTQAESVAPWCSRNVPPALPRRARP